MNEKIEYRIILSDRTEDNLLAEDIGLIKLKKQLVPQFGTSDKMESRVPNHWITFPDGSVRRRYNYRTIEHCDGETMSAFEALPMFKVSYRPIAKFCKMWSEFVLGVMLFVMLLTFVIGGIGGLYFAATKESIFSFTMYGFPVGYYASYVVGVSGFASIILYTLFRLGENRYTHSTKDDSRAIRMGPNFDEYVECDVNASNADEQHLSI